MNFKISTAAILGAILGLTSCGNESDLTSSNDVIEPVEISTRISMEDARIELINILDDLYGAETRDGMAPGKNISSCYVRHLQSNTRAEDGEEPSVYVFNFDDEEGFAIMSADTRIPSLLALAESGSLQENEETDNPGLNIFLERLGDYVVTGGGWGGNIPIPPITPTDPLDPNPTYGEWYNIVHKVNGFCPVKWAQHIPYNSYCPKKNDKLTPAGCVPVAVAQLMAVYKYPSSYKYDASSSTYTFNWDEMTKYKYAPFLSTVYKNQIARLLQQLGLKNNLNVDYQLDESGALVADIPKTLKAFGYSQGGNCLDYSTLRVVEEIKNDYPIIISGFGYKDNKKGGHAWLGHGLLERKREVTFYSETLKQSVTTYETNYYIMCNWGWEEKGDGYYLSNVFSINDNYNPLYEDGEQSTRGIDYNMNVVMITGIRK